MAQYRCIVCEFVYDEEKNDSLWMDVPDDYTCSVCGSPKRLHEKIEENLASDSEMISQNTETVMENGPDESLLRSSDDIETYMADIHQMAQSGESITEPMRTRKPTFSWDELLIKGAHHDLRFTWWAAEL